MKVQNLILLNVLFIFSCIPLITAGAALAALYDTLRSSAHRSPGMAVLERYWLAFKTHLKSATAIWVPVLLFCLLLAADFVWISAMAAPGRYIFLGIFLFIGFLIADVTTVAFPLLTYRQERGKRLVTLSLGVSSCCLRRVIPAVLLKILPLLVLALFPAVFARLFLVWGLLYFAVSEQMNVVLLEEAFAILKTEDST